MKSRLVNNSSEEGCLVAKSSMNLKGSGPCEGGKEMELKVPWDTYPIPNPSDRRPEWPLLGAADEVAFAGNS